MRALVWFLGGVGLVAFIWRFSVAVGGMLCRNDEAEADHLLGQWMGSGMRLKNMITGDVLELPPPNELGQGTILLNGVVVERLLWSDADGGSVTLLDGRMFPVGSKDFNDYVFGLAAHKESQVSKGRA